MAEGPVRSVRRKRFLFVAAGLLVTVGVIATLGAGAVYENQEDSRNNSYGEVSGGKPTTDCWSHHRDEGAYDTFVVVPIVPLQIKLQEATKVKVQIVNAWKWDIAALDIDVAQQPDPDGSPVAVPLLGAQGVAPATVYRFDGELFNARNNATLSQIDNNEGALGGRIDTRWLNFSVPSNPPPKQVFISIRTIFPEGTGPTPQAPVVFTAKVGDAAAGDTGWAPHAQNGLYYNWTFTAPQGGVLPSQSDWQIWMTYNSGNSNTLRYEVNVTVVGGVSTAATYSLLHVARIPSDAAAVPSNVVVAPNAASEPFEFEILGLRKGTQEFEIHARGELWFDHKTHNINDDVFNRYYNFTVEVGDTFVASTASLAEGSVAKVPFVLQTGEITGFAGGFLLFPSLLFGGTYGRGSRKFFNTVLGGAKRRVMFHNLMSLGLILVAFVHILLFLIELRYTVLMGVLWGGLGALTLLILGLTGYYQVPLIQRYGYNWWRYVHLAAGVLVVVFVAYHAIMDGADFDEMKQVLPESIRGLNLAPK